MDIQQPKESRKKRKQRDINRSYGSYLQLGEASTTYCVTLSYDGSNFGGFQLQDDPTTTIRTVQAVVEDALQRTTNETIRIRSTSRTDKGVHALGQVIAFSSKVATDCDTFLKAMNSRLPDDVVGLKLVVAPSDDYDPRKESKRKCYVYRLRHGAIRNVLDRNQVWQISKPLNVKAMKEAACFMESEQPQNYLMFTPARTLKPDQSTICCVSKVEISSIAEDPYALRFEVQGNRFLYKMVRTMVGILVDVGLGKLTPQDVHLMLSNPTPRTSSSGAPPHGLVLQWIEFET